MNCSNFYRHFRILLTGGNDCGNKFIACGGIEIYGSLKDAKAHTASMSDRTLFWNKSYSEKIQMLNLQKEPVEENDIPSAFRMTGETEEWQTIKVCSYRHSNMKLKYLVFLLVWIFDRVKKFFRKGDIVLK